MKTYISNYGRERVTMTKIRINVRGDSGLSDSQLTSVQKLFYKKNQKALDELEEYSIMEMNRRRFQENSKNSKKSLWYKIRTWF